jgi:hypothetical protein
MTYRNPSDDRADEAERDRREAGALLSGMTNRRRSTVTLVAFLAVLGTALAVGGLIVYRSTQKPASSAPALNPLTLLCTKSGGNLKMEPCCGEDYPGTCAPGPFGCAPSARHACVICDCPASQCFDVDAGCIKSPY